MSDKKHKIGEYLIKLHKRNKAKRHRHWIEDQINNGGFAKAIQKAMNGYNE